MTYNTELYDIIVRHAADMRLYEAEVQLNNNRSINRHRARLETLLKGDLRSDVTPEVRRAMLELYTSTSAALNEYDTTSVSFHANALQKTTGKFFQVVSPVTGSMVAEQVVGPNIGLSKPLKAHFDNIGVAEISRIQTIVGRGIAEQESTKDIIDRVMLTTNLTRNQVAALVRTSLTNTRSSAMNRVMEANKPVLFGYRFTAVLDSRTSITCSSRDGKVYGIDDMSGRPPLHWNCRSTMVPILKSKTQLQAEKNARINQSMLEKESLEKLDGNSPPVEDYSTWLRRQPMSVQIDHLGSEERAALFQKGTLAVKEFFSDIGKRMSIQTLRLRDSLRTFNVPFRQQLVRDAENGVLKIAAARPYDLMRSTTAQEQLRAMYIADAMAPNQPMSTTDFRGTSLVGKRATRVKANSSWDEGEISFDPITGEQVNKYVYDPDFSVYQERLDFMHNSKLLSKEQKAFIQGFAESLEDQVSVNNQSVVVENLRLLFERYEKDHTKWDDLTALARNESRFSVVNVSRILDRRSRERSEIFSSYGQGDTPKVMVMGKYFTFDDLQSNLLDNQRYVQNWAESEGRTVAHKIYFSGRSPLKSYFLDPNKDENIFQTGLIKPIAKKIEGITGMFDRPPSETLLQSFGRSIRETYRSIIDAEYNLLKSKRSYADWILSQSGNDAAVKVLSKVLKLVATGQSTDYDSLAIKIGQTLNENWQPLLPWNKHTLQDHHVVGSRILQGLRDQGKIRVLSRGTVRRSVVDLETGRASGPWKNTVSREVIVLDKSMLELQSRSRQVVLAQRFGIVDPRDKLYALPNAKTYVDSRGKDTGISIVTRRASGNYDKVLVDRDFADMLNHTMSTKYEVDPEFAGFMDEVVRFRDPRGKVKEFDEINEFRKLIITRGDQGYGFMQTVRWHKARGKPFTVMAQIDGRGRVYYSGYLTPTGGEVVRPFLNSADYKPFGIDSLKELMLQTGALIGPATDALTQAGRLAIFEEHKNDIISLGNLLLSTTQRDQKIRLFLNHPLIKGLDGEEVPKMTRLALEYARAYNYCKGNFSANSLQGFKSKLMIENDASSSGAQIIGLSTRDRDISINSNVLATTRKNRLYDLVAMDTVADPEFQQIEAFRNAGITWVDLQKAAKAQNMVSFYGAGKATQAANIEAKFAAVLQKKGYLVITRENLRDTTKLIDKAIKDAEYLGATETIAGLKALKKEIIEVVTGEVSANRALLSAAEDLHPDVAVFVAKLMDTRAGLVGPDDFKEVSRIMSKHLAERAPITGKFVQFWKDAAKTFVTETEKVDIPWVTFDGKKLYQRYRPKVQTSIEFYDSESKRMVRNIYEDAVRDGKLRGKASLANAGIGTGVNGNHMNDATIVRWFHLWGYKNGIGTASIHDAFFTHISDVDKAKNALREIYAKAVEGNTIENTLKAMRADGMSRESYERLYKKAVSDGLINPPNGITRDDVLAKIPVGFDWYGIGP